MHHLAIFALGPLRIEMDGKSLQTSRHKALALLVYLAVQRGQQSREALSGLLWPDYEQKKAYAYLRRTLWEIHTLLGKDSLEVDRDAIGFSVKAGISLDVAEFKNHLEAVNQHDHFPTTICQECIAHLHTAALLYRGDFLSGFGLRDSTTFEDWQFFQREALRGDYALAIKKLAILFTQAASYAEASIFAQRWLALDTLNEEAHRQLMQIYALEGQRHKSLRQYQECTRILHTELGIAPEQATTDLYESILSDKIDLVDKTTQKQPETLAPKSAEADSTLPWLEKAFLEKEILPVSNLPTPSTPFIGRRQELQQVAALLLDPDCWLLTLLGPGGMGKTRLAVEAGSEHVNHFPQGVHFISLNTVETEQAFVALVASSLGLVFRQHGPAPEEQLLDFLREKRILIILDAFEGLVQWANWLGEIHSHAPGIKMLVTSRHRLMLQGECVLEVNGLDYPPIHLQNVEPAQSEDLKPYSAVELFLHAARRVRVTFQPTQEDSVAIIHTAQLLEGMPLALEMAATWVNTLSCQEIVQEIRRGLDILETTLGDISERQSSMKAVFDHSWRLLSNREQVLLPRLAVFRGSFSRQAAEQIAGISLRELSGLVDKSLVRRTPQGRFDLHDLLRQYCAVKLDRQPEDKHATYHRLCAYYSNRLAQWYEALNGKGQGRVLQEIEMAMENIQVVWEWAVRHGLVEYLAQDVDGLCMFYLRRARFTEGINACHKAVAAIHEIEPEAGQTQRSRLMARLRIWQAVFCMNLERFDEAGQFLLEGQRIMNDPQTEQILVVQEQIFGLVIQTLLANLQYDSTSSLHLVEKVFSLSKKTSGKAPSFWVYFWRFLMGGGSVSKELYKLIEQNQEDVLQGGNPFEIGCHLFVLGIAELFHYYRIEKAEKLLIDSCKSFELVEDPSTQVMVFKTLGYLSDVQGKFEDYYALKQREIAIYQDFGDRRMIGMAQSELGEALYHLGKYRQAEDHIRQWLAFFHGQNETEVALRHRYLGDALLAQGKFPEAQEAYLFSYRYFQSINERGWMLTALTGLSRVEFALGDRSNAWIHAYQALGLYEEMQLYTFFVYLTLAEFALLLTDQGQIIEALELYGLVMQQGYLAHSRWFADLFGRYIEGAASQLSLEAQTAARKRGQELDFSKTIESLRTHKP